MNEQCEQTSEWMSESPDVLTSRFYVFLSISFTPQNLTIIPLFSFASSSGQDRIKVSEKRSKVKIVNVAISMLP